jgi:hypothetical protein
MRLSSASYQYHGPREEPKRPAINRHPGSADGHGVGPRQSGGGELDTPTQIGAASAD